MDHFYTQICQQRIRWRKTDEKHKEEQQYPDIQISWSAINQLDQQYSKSGDMANIEQVTKENIDEDQKAEQFSNSSISDYTENDITPKNIDENKNQNTEQFQRTSNKRNHTQNVKQYRTFSQYLIDEQFVRRYRSNKRSARTMSMIQIKKSLITPVLKNISQKSQKTIRIRYLDSPYYKTLQVDKNILACEFIVLAIQEFIKTPSFDQNLLKYANFSLAYQLISFDDYCDFSALQSRANSPPEEKNSTFGDLCQNNQYAMDESFIKQNNGIFLELNQPINFQNLTLQVSDQDLYEAFGTDLSTIEVTKKEFPDLIIILIQEAKSKTFYNCRLSLDQTIEDIFNKLQKYNKNEAYLTLKFPCVNMNNSEPLHLQFPIRLLPIHWLVMQFKYEYNQIAASFSFKDQQINPSVCQLSMVRSQSQSFIENEEQIDKMPKIFNYEEYDATKVEEDGLKNEVMIGIDYFDFYYYYKFQKKRKLTLYKITKYFVQFLLKNHQSGQSKDYKRIPTSQIISVNLNDTGVLEIKFHKNEDTTKKLQFIYLKPKSDDSDQINQQKKENNLNEIAQKIQLILQQRRRNFYYLQN